MLVGLAPPVARRQPPLLAGPQVVPQVVGEYALVDEHVALGRTALVVDGEGPPLRAHGAVVDQGHQGAGHLLADHAGVDRRVLDDVVGLETVAARLVEQDAAAAPGQDHGQLARRSGPGRQLGQGPAGGQLGQLLDRDLVEQLEPHGAGRRLEPGLQAGVARGHARDREAGPDLFVRASSPSELAIRTCRREPPQPAWTWVMASPVARAASSARVQELEGVPLRHRWRGSVRSTLVARSPVRRVGTATVLVPPPPLRATAEAASAARSRPDSDRSAVWANPVVSPEPPGCRPRGPGRRTAPPPARRRGGRTTSNGPRRTPRRSHRRGAAPRTALVRAPGNRSRQPPRWTARRSMVADVSCCHLSYRRGPAHRSFGSHRTAGDRGRHRRGPPVGHRSRCWPHPG